jgi:hypothetical protein
LRAQGVRSEAADAGKEGGRRTKPLDADWTYPDFVDS